MKLLDTLTKPGVIKLILLACIGFFFFTTMQQCNRAKSFKEEMNRLENNQRALQDTVRNYKDSNGDQVGEIRGLTLKLNEIREDYEWEKNKPPVTIVEFETKIDEKIIEVPILVTDTFIITDNDTFRDFIKLNKFEVYGESSRELDLKIPYIVEGDSLKVGISMISLKQHISLSASLFREKKSKEVWIKVTTDYPGTTFGDIKGVLIQDDKALKKFNMQSRKEFGLGFNIGYSFAPLVGEFTPTIGVGINYTPRWLQW